MSEQATQQTNPQSQATPASAPAAKPAKGIGIHESAVARLRELMVQRQTPEAGLRIAVRGGGCSGLSYALEWAEKPRERDKIFEREGVRTARDKAAAQARGDVTDPAAAQAAKAGRPEPPEPGAPKNDVAPGTNAPAEAAPTATGTPAAGGQTNPSNPAQNRSP